MTIYIIIFLIILLGFYGKIINHNKKDLLINLDLEEKIDEIYFKYQNIKLKKIIDKFQIVFVLLLITSIILVYYYNIKEFQISIYIIGFILIKDFYTNQSFKQGFQDGCREFIYKKS